MSNYLPLTDFSIKDALTTGDPDKLIVGAEFDDEFDAIATMSSTKEDAANKGASNGYCGLDGSGLVAVSDLPAASTSAKGVIEIATSAETRTGTSATLAITPDSLGDRYSACQVLGGSGTKVGTTGEAGGWSVANPGTGTYVVTHGYGDSSYHVWVSVMYTGATNPPYVAIISQHSSSTFTIVVYDSTNTAVDPTRLFIRTERYA